MPSKLSQLRLLRTMNQLQQVRADIELLNNKLAELYATMRMIFEHHPNDTCFHFEVVNTDRFNRVTAKTGFEELINELEDSVQERRETEERLQQEIVQLAS